MKCSIKFLVVLSTNVANISLKMLKLQENGETHLGQLPYEKGNKAVILDISCFQDSSTISVL